MSDYNSQILATIAFAQVTSTSSDATVVANRGFTTITRSSAGVYVLTREAGMTGAALPVAEVVLSLCLQGTVAKMGSAVDDGAGAVTVRTFNDSGTATDCSFTLVVSRSTNHESD